MTPRKLKIHPVADLFPMLPKEELEQLAESIAAHGLKQPIVLDKEGRILDGRNRQAACDLVKVKPEYVTYEGDDPDVYALVVNIARRHLTKGQQAMVAARGLIDSISQIEAAHKVGISNQYLSHANIVLQFAEELADDIISGATPFDQAYKTAKERKANVGTKAKKLDDLREEAPDLADQVVEERLTLEEAQAAHRARVEERKRLEGVASRFLIEHIVPLCGLPDNVPPQYAELAPDALTDEQLESARKFIEHLQAEISVRR